MHERPGTKAELVTQAKTISRQLLWLAGRTRPETGFSVSRMSQMITVDPSETITRGVHIRTNYVTQRLRTRGIWIPSWVRMNRAAGEMSRKKEVGNPLTLVSTQSAMDRQPVEGATRGLTCAFSGAFGSAEHLTWIIAIPATSSRSQTYILLKFVGEDLFVLSLYVVALRRRKGLRSARSPLSSLLNRVYPERDTNWVRCEEVLCGLESQLLLCV